MSTQTTIRLFNKKEARLCFDNPANDLLQLHEFETKISEVLVSDRIKARILLNNTLVFLYQGKEFFAEISRPLIHQLGGRIWPEMKLYPAIEKKWCYFAKIDPSYLEQLIAKAFINDELVIRYFQKNNTRNVYGIVTPHFVKQSLLEFRKHFIEKLKGTALSPRSHGIHKDFFGNVVETFKLNTEGFQTSYQYGLVYARNTGYEAFKVNWGREVLICKNGLTKWEGTSFRWKHTHEVNPEDFINSTINDGIVNQQFIEKRIETANGTALTNASLKELLEKLAFAKASKDKLLSRYEIEAKTVGHNDWALSQAATWLGTHETHTPQRTRKQFTALGTGVLENSLASCLTQPETVDAQGFFELLLPKQMCKPYSPSLPGHAFMA